MRYATHICAAALVAAAFCGAGAADAAPGGRPVPPTPIPRAFGRGEVSYHPTRFAPYTFDDTIVRVRFDFASGIVYGHETAIVRPKKSGLRDLPFNTLGIRYDSVRVNGAPAHYRIDTAAQTIDVALARPAARGERLKVDFVYSAQPQRGIYFIRPDRGYPHETPEIWSQGEMVDNRRWFPTWDEPNQKTPSELIVTVARGWTVVANGSLKSHTLHGTTETWDWNAPHPKSTYLIAFAAGPLSKHHTSLGQANDGNVAHFGDGSDVVDSYVQPRWASLNALCFGDTNDIVAHFQKIIGIKFPWPKYDQTTAERFTYGGMENASATIQTSLALHPASENAVRPCDSLVAHELAHQWWGDDVTMSDWSNTWINEGFATYFQELWSEKHFGEPEFEYERYRAQQAYFGEARQYERPIVDYRYNDPLDLFDASGYQRPGEVLHMLRYMFGDRRFFKALHDYLSEYQYKNADTHDFFAAIDRSLGTNLGWFENEWFFRAGYPHYTVKQHYDAKNATLTLDVTQHNIDHKPFRMPIAVEAYFGKNGIRRVQPTIDRNRQTIRIAGVTSAPKMVLFDPNDNVIKALTFPKTLKELAYQAVYAKHVGDREWAIEQIAKLGAKHKQEAEDTLREVALFDPFYGLRADATQDAAQLGDASVVDAALHDHDPRVVIAAEQAAATLQKADGPVVARLHQLTADADPLVSGAAYAAIGGIKAPHAFETLRAALNRRSFRETIAADAERGLAALGDPRALPLLEARTAYGTPEQERSSAVIALAQLASKTHETAQALHLLLPIASHDPLITTRIIANAALGILGDPAAIPTLQHDEATDSQQAVQGAAYGSILDIKDAQNMKAYKARLAIWEKAHPTARKRK